MKIFVLVWICFYVLYAECMNQKMVISAHVEAAEAADDLYHIEKLFEENTQAVILKKKHGLLFSMELLEPYVLVTITPISSGEVKNKLRYLLQSEFPKNFVVDNSSMQSNLIVKKKVAENIRPLVKKTLGIDRKTNDVLPLEKDAINMVRKIKIFWRNLESEWLGLLFLALAGFLLVYRSATQMNKIKQLQEEVTQYQSKITGEMKYMRDKDA